MKRRNFIKGSAIIGATITNASKLEAGSGMYTTNSQRKVHRILNASRTKVGTLPILRAFAGNHEDYVSPFVLFDEFGPVEVDAGSDPLRVDAHPHAGVIPTTYFISGTGHHKDSLDYDFEIGRGDFMMFSSGKGAIHMEESGQRLYQEGGAYHGFQIWLNMPAANKFDDPNTSVNNEDKMAIIDNDQFYAKVILGSLDGQNSDIDTLSPAFYYHIKIKENGRIDIPTNPMHNAFAYVVNGEMEVVDQKEVKTNQIVLYQRGESTISLFSKCGAELLVLGGKPLNEPVFSYGPFVMNNKEQIDLCIRNYSEGKMGNPDLVNR